MVTNVTELKETANSFIDKFSSSLLSSIPLHEYFIFTLVLVFIILAFILVVKHGVPIIFEGFFGKINITPKNKDNNAINMCDLCVLNVVSLITNVVELCYKINKTEQLNLREQIREIDKRFFLENSWINDCHANMVAEKLAIRQDLSEIDKTKIAMKNNQILNYIWQIKRQEIYEFIKNIIMINNFTNKNPIELRYFVHENSKVLIASLEMSTNLFPDWDDPELLFERQEYVQILIPRIRPRIEESIQSILENCQVIQRKHKDEINNLEMQKIKIVEEFKKSLPPNKKEEN